eukprot:783150-Amphidinium_carterae.2
MPGSDGTLKQHAGGNISVVALASESFTRRGGWSSMASCPSLCMSLVQLFTELLREQEPGWHHSSSSPHKESVPMDNFFCGGPIEEVLEMQCIMHALQEKQPVGRVQ